MEIDCNLKKLANVFKLLCIVDNLLKTSRMVCSFLEKPLILIFLPGAQGAIFC